MNFSQHHPFMKNMRIDIDKPRYDQSTYWNRFLQMNEVCGAPSWRTLFTTQAELNEAIELLERYKRGNRHRTNLCQQFYEKEKT